MLTELLRNCTMFLFWLLAFNVMLAVDIAAAVTACILLKELGEKWSDMLTRRKKEDDPEVDGVLYGSFNEPFPCPGDAGPASCEGSAGQG